jgi:hypothetical protein
VSQKQDYLKPFYHPPREIEPAKSGNCTCWISLVSRNREVKVRFEGWFGGKAGERRSLMEYFFINFNVAEFGERPVTAANALT